MRIIILLLTLFLTACTGGGADTTLLVPPIERLSQQRIIELIYNPLYTVPEGFYVDELADNPNSFTVYHVKDLSRSYELCTNNFDEALAWEQADNDSRFVQGAFVGWTENDRYFQVERLLHFTQSVGNAGDFDPGFARVFKCSYVNRNGVDRELTSGFAGILNAELSQPLVDTFVQYMSQWKFWWPRTVNILTTWSWEETDIYTHILTIGSRKRQGTGRCDLIEVFDWRWTVDKATGEVTKKLEFVDRFEAELVNRTPQVCQ